MFVYCTKCKWNQDDFWEKGGYTPFRDDLMDHLRERLFEDRFYADSSFFRTYPELTPDGTDELGPWVYSCRYVAWSLRRTAASIERMLFRTEEEFNARGDEKWDCPVCGAKNTLRAD